MSLLEAVADVARIAGDTANRFFGSPISVETKADGSPVTQADRAAEAAARAFIEAVTAYFPVEAAQADGGATVRLTARNP